MELQEIPPTKKSSKKETDAQNHNTENQDEVNIVKERKMRFGSYRQTMRCPYCQAKMTTRLETYATIRTHLTAALLCLVCLWPCVPCVYCSDKCLTHKHYCDNCNKFLGSSTFINSLRKAPM